MFFNYVVLLALTFGSPYQSAEYSYNYNSDVKCTAQSPCYYGALDNGGSVLESICYTEFNFTLSYDREGTPTIYFKGVNFYVTEVEYDYSTNTELHTYDYAFSLERPIYFNSYNEFANFFNYSNIHLERLDDSMHCTFVIYEGNNYVYQITKNQQAYFYVDNAIDYYVSYECYTSDFNRFVDSQLYDSSSYDTGYTEGYNTGYSEGVTDTMATGSTAQVIFTGIIDVALIPINFFLACLNFEVFGINIGGFVSALLTIAIVVILIRSFMGGKGGDSND